MFVAWTLKQTSQPIRAAWIEIGCSSQSARHFMSQPIRAAWIEIPYCAHFIASCSSQPIRAAWIEMENSRKKSINLLCRSPFGLRGLKYLAHRAMYFEARWSQPIRAAWIEISYCGYSWLIRSCRSPFGLRGLKSSLPLARLLAPSVAAHSGCVD